MITFPNVTPEILDLYLMHTNGPGCFTDEGFVAGGTPTSGLWEELELRINELAPYSPSEISNLQVDFSKKKFF